MTSVAGGRAKRRKLAQALAARPAVLTDGRSPAPRVVGDLLIALRKAGAVMISPPVCAGCGKHLRTLQRRGQDWYCAVCGPRPGRCAACGQQRIITSLDRRGQPRCASCPDRDDRDPLAVLAEVVGRLDPSLPAKRSPPQPGGCSPGPPSCASWPGPWRTCRGCSPGPARRRRCRACCGSSTSSATPERSRSSARPARAAAGSSAFTGGLAGSGAAATASPGPEPSRARGAGPSASPPSATRPACRCVLTA